MGSGSNDDNDVPVGALGSLVRPAAVKGTEGIQASDPVTSVDPPEDATVDSICQMLSAGTITPAQAQEHLIDSVLREQLGPLSDPVLEAQVREEIAALLDGDPTLTRLLDPRP